MTSKRDSAPDKARKPFVLLEDVPGLGSRGSVQTLTQTKADELGAKVRLAGQRDLQIAGKA
ncbi:hypothetical protein [Roseibium sediminicola]|uniref:Uncharacterized protein n=1 Tax=Roseibium sediminicola TaxID=2933272 RepID=A0ABT0H0H3_9HYPH|nr:hypothetical protein [Roseibium sp. CAU 1639]MCK7615181.1 hypothetical protein [Roseibium sp. CAU 1639]